MSTFGGTALTGENLLVTGGRIYPQADSEHWVEAMLVNNGVVTDIGDEALLRTQHRTSIRELDLDGRTVLPGFVDAHTHIEATAISRNMWLDVRGLTAADACARIARAAAGTEPGSWVLAQGTFLQPLPSRDDLDKAAPNVPVLMRESAHRIQANSEALRLAGLTKRVPTVGPGVVVHVDEHGVPTGLVEEALDLFPVPEISDGRLDAMIVKELRESFARRGVTTAYEIPITAKGAATFIRLARAGDLPVRITLTPFVGPGVGHSLERIELWNPRDFGADAGSDMVAAGGVKILLDGDNEQSFDTSYFERQPRQWGAVTRTLGGLREEIIWAIQNRVQVWVHAIGDLAQEMMLEAVDQAQLRAGRPVLPTRLEHAANLQLSDGILSRLKVLNVIPVPTASFMATDDGSGLYAYRTLLDSGLCPPGNSDTAGSIALAPSPWFGIAHLIDRKNAQGVPVAPEEAITIWEAVRTYTEYSAAAAGLQAVIGSLKRGAAADFAAYEDDPRHLPPAEMREVEADITFVGGRVVWQR